VNLEKLFKKGNPSNAEDGFLLLVNEEETAYAVKEAVMMIWNMCNGISFTELVNSIAGEVDQDAIALKPSLEGLMNELKEAKLLELREK